MSLPNIRSLLRDVLLAVTLALVSTIYNPLGTEIFETAIYMLFGVALTDLTYTLVAFLNSYPLTWLFFSLTAYWLSARAARKAGKNFLLHALLTTIPAAILINLIIALRFDPYKWWEAPLYLLLGAVASWLGARKGRRDYARGAALAHAHDALATAKDPRDVFSAAAAPLRVLGATRVSLFRPSPPLPAAQDGEPPHRSWAANPPALPPSGRWIPWNFEDETLPSEQPTPLEIRNEVTRLELARHRWTTLQGDLRTLLANTDKPPAPSGAHMVHLVSLIVPNGRQIGLLAAFFRRGPSIPASAREEYLAVANHAAISLDNIRLTEEATLRERDRLSTEVHDTVLHDEAKVIMDLENVLLRMGPEANPTLQRAVQAARDTARKNAQRLRDIVRAQDPPLLKRHPFSEALAIHAREWSKKTGIETSFLLAGSIRPCSSAIERELFGLLNEALNNADKHAGATKVTLSLSYKGERIALHVSDNGRGFVPDRPYTGPDKGPGGHGLLNMRRRAAKLNGDLRIESAPGNGTVIKADVPI